MNPLLAVLLSYALSQIKTDDVARWLGEIASLIDPLIAKRGFVMRQVWGLLRGQLTSPSVVADCGEFIADLKVEVSKRASDAANA